MKCNEAKLLLSPYLDGAMAGGAMRALAAHLEACPACKTQFAELQKAHGLVAGLGRRQAPSDLALRLRVLASQEMARNRSSALQRFMFRLDDALEPLMLPATAGLLAAIIFFGVLIGFFAIPAELAAADDADFYTPPQLQATSPFVSTMPSEAAVVVDAEVDPQGRVQDYHIISAPPEARALLPELNNIIIFTTFRPATSFGQPTTGRVVLSFSRINVRG
jgi:hypothetical protein